MTKFILRKICQNCGEDNDKTGNVCINCHELLDEEVLEERTRL